MTRDVILLNGDYTAMGVISWKKAMILIVKGKVEIIKQSDIALHTTKNVVDFFLPLVIRLLKFIRQIYKTRVTFNKRNVHIRDAYTCQYCGKKLTSKTASLDHVIPLSKNGPSDFKNTVTSCVQCNNEKDNRTPTQAGMFLKRKPFQPTIHEFMLIQIKTCGLSKYLKELGLL